jgi:hypothetical protein
MELTLNLVWVCVAIAGILVQIVMLSRYAAASGRPANSWPKIMAMGCALVILFFVISMTDDLHDQALLLEDSKLSRITSGTGTSEHCASDRSTGLHLLQFFPVVPFSLPGLPAGSRLIGPLKLRFAATIECEKLRGRAPPVIPA